MVGGEKRYLRNRYAISVYTYLDCVVCNKRVRYLYAKIFYYVKINVKILQKYIPKDSTMGTMVYHLVLIAVRGGIEPPRGI